MPTTMAREPTISQVYEAFDAACHRVFRAAMGRSRGGVVQVSDLVESLRRLEQHASGGFSDLVPTSPQHVATESSCIPMSNEPALRALLQDAYVLAEAQPQDETVITPTILWAVVLLRNAFRLMIPPSEFLSDLGLIPTDRILERVTTPRTAPPPLRQPPIERMITSMNDVVTRQPQQLVRQLRPLRRFPSPAVAAQIESVLNEWIAMQTVDSDSEREAVIARLGQRIREIEQMD